MPTIDIQGTPHAYDLTPPTGADCTLVFVHGWLLSRGYWQPLVERLSSAYPCLTYDLRGFGESQPAAPARSPGGESGAPVPVRAQYVRYAPTAYAEDLRVLLDRLGVESAWLVGHSLGGTIALWSANRMPDRVKGIVCLNSGGGIYLKEEFERFRSVGRRLVQWRPQWLRWMPLVDWAFSRESVANPVDRQWGRRRAADFVAAHSEAALWTLLASTTEAEVHKLPQVVSRLAQPAYFIAGAEDRIMAPKYVRHLASFHPLFHPSGENLIEIPDCGHMGMVEQPDAVADRLRSILARHAPAPAAAPG